MKLYKIYIWQEAAVKSKNATRRAASSRETEGIIWNKLWRTPAHHKTLRSGDYKDLLLLDLSKIIYYDANKVTKIINIISSLTLLLTPNTFNTHLKYRETQSLGMPNRRSIEGSTEAKAGFITSLQPLMIQCSPSLAPRAPSLQECEVIIRQLYNANSLQSQEVRLSADHSDHIYMPNAMGCWIVIGWLYICVVYQLSRCTW